MTLPSRIGGRSRAFWSHYYPLLRSELPEALSGVSEEGFHREVNRVARTLIRTESDETTYNLHIMLRFELEQAMVVGDRRPWLAAWNWTT